MLPNKTILLGDFNFPDINWDTLSGFSLHANLFCDLIFRFNLSQLVTSPTHICGNILDLVLCNDPDFINNLSINRSQENHLLSDHHKITFTMFSSHPWKPKVRSHYALNLAKADWLGLTSYLLDHDFNHLYSLSDSWLHLVSPETNSYWLLRPIHPQGQSQGISKPKVVHLWNRTRPKLYTFTQKSLQKVSVPIQ